MFVHWIVCIAAVETFLQYIQCVENISKHRLEDFPITLTVSCASQTNM